MILQERTTLHWTPDRKRKRGRPRTTWRRTVESEMKAMQITDGDEEGMMMMTPRGRTLI